MKRRLKKENCHPRESGDRVKGSAKSNPVPPREGGDHAGMTIVFLLLILAGLSACYTPFPQGRPAIADRIAHPSFMIKRMIQTDPFVLTAYERIRDKSKTATVYIEGDGITWLNFTKAAQNPTPAYPVSLHLASRDNSKNVIYLARPCQYQVSPTEICRDNIHWTSGRYSETVVKSMSAALDNIKNHYGIPAFHLVGWSGGGTIATILAGRRHDILSLRTVAANLDHEMLSIFLNVRPFEDSLDAYRIADTVARVPQHHFVGERDDVVPAFIYQSFRENAGFSTCMRHTVIEGAAHEKGWVNRWPELLKAPVNCHSDE